MYIIYIFHKPALSLDVSTINQPFLAWLVLAIAEPWTVGAGTAGLLNFETWIPLFFKEKTLGNGDLSEV